MNAGIGGGGRWMLIFSPRIGLWGEIEGRLLFWGEWPTVMCEERSNIALKGGGRGNNGDDIACGWREELKSLVAEWVSIGSWKISKGRVVDAMPDVKE